VGVGKVIGYVWLENWNEKGIEGLKPIMAEEDLQN